MLKKDCSCTSSTDAADSNFPVLPPEPCDCDNDPVAGIKKLFVDYFQGVGMAQGRDPATRPVFLRLHGVAHGCFEVCADLPDKLKVGVFAEAQSFPVWVRFSSDVQPGLPDLKGTMGIAVKLFGVPGEKLLEPDQNAQTQDFILQNHDVFFVDTARDMCEFTCQSLHGKSDDYLSRHPETAQILEDMAKVVDSALTTPYWSVLPSCFGEQGYVKYKLEPETASLPCAEAAPDYNDPTYLRADLHERLKKGEARFRFLLQFQTNDEQMPLDKATVRWSEEASSPIHVATLILPAQDLDTRGQSTYGENLAFNTWHSLPAHSPVGSLAEARKVAYRASAENRRNVNGVPLGEPEQARPAQYQAGVDYPAAKDSYIVRAAIHPAIGVARVGNSRDEFFIGPEVLEPAAAPLGFYRDPQGAIKRQAAQFRIYGYNAAGDVVRELTADWADIRWTVHVANRKAAWYQWQIAMDIPEAASTVLPLRNAKITDKAGRETLMIDGGAQSISGKNASGVAFTGLFTGVPVYLGELRTDDEGRLQFLGGHGVSASPTGSPIFIPTDDNSFINADGWYDDTSDGPVSAEVSIEGRAIPVEPAWVVTAPPDFAPQLKAERTLYDLLYDLYVQAGWLQAPARISFTHDVYPILQRLTGLQWVNQGFATQFGFGGQNDFEDPDYIAKLIWQPAPGEYDLYQEMRRQIFNSFRSPISTDSNQLPWPWIYGDAMENPAGDSPRQNATITTTQYQVLQQWVNGDFINDWGLTAPPPASLADVPLSEQPAMLDRAALDFCLADAFHPGCEMTWPMRHLTMYNRPFRIRHRPAGVPEPSYGPTLDQQQVLAADGPLHQQGPGDINRWMGLPWQADTAFCRSGYDTTYDPFQPTFWPARVPNQVLTERDYAIVTDPAQALEKRLEAFANRTDWNKPLHGGIAEQMEQMVRIFGSMGLLEEREGPKDDPDFPSVMLVASYGPDVAPADTGDTAMTYPMPGLKAAAEQKEQKKPSKGVNFASAQEARKAPLPVRRSGK